MSRRVPRATDLARAFVSSLRRSTALLVTCLFAAPGPAFAASYVTNDDPRCVDDVVAAFERLDHHGEPMGFRVDEDDLVNPSQSCHWQSVARHPVSGNIFYVTKNSNCLFYSDDAGLGIVRLGTDQSNLARRSNLHARGSDYQDTPPPADQRLERFLPLRFGEEHLGPDYAQLGYGYQHLGGMQAAGMLLAVPYEAHSLEPQYPAMVGLFDTRQPDDPRTLRIAGKAGMNALGLYVRDETMGAVGVVLDEVGADGVEHYLVLALYDGNTRLRIWSISWDPRDPSVISIEGESDAVDYAGQIYDIYGKTVAYSGKSFQNLQLVRDCGGALYAVGTRIDNVNVAPPPGFPPQISRQDHVYLHEVVIDGDPGVRDVSSFGGIELLETLHVYCTNAATDGERYCDFDAGAGVYVSPQGALGLYGIEHDNDGAGASTKMTEFWDQTGNPGASCEAEGAWLTLYADVDFEGQTLTMTHANESSDDFDDFTEIPWNDAPSSFRACLPAGCALDICQDVSFEDCTTIYGPSGADATQLYEDSNLHSSDQAGVSSVRFRGACGPVGGWSPGEPNGYYAEDCAVIRLDGLLDDADCGQERPWACQSLSDPLDWMQSEGASAWLWSLDCPAGYAFRYPRDAAEQQALASRIGEPVWVNLMDAQREGRFEMGFTPASFALRAESVLLLLDELQAAGDIRGTGYRLSEARLSILRWILERAHASLDAENVDRACRWLGAALLHVDGKWLPPDLVTGEGTVELFDAIAELRADMGCEAILPAPLCGLGPELALIVPALALWRRRWRHQAAR